MFNAGNGFEYEVSHQNEDGTDDQENRRKNYRRGRSFRPTRRRSRKVASAHPGHGIAGRRNRRWAW